MPVLSPWEEYEKAAERLYLQNPMKTRYTMKYDHTKGMLELKITDNVICIQYKTQSAQDVRKMERFVSNLMRHMASKEHN